MSLLGRKKVPDPQGGLDLELTLLEDAELRAHAVMTGARNAAHAVCRDLQLFDNVLWARASYGDEVSLYRSWHRPEFVETLESESFCARSEAISCVEADGNADVRLSLSFTTYALARLIDCMRRTGTPLDAGPVIGMARSFSTLAHDYANRFGEYAFISFRQSSMEPRRNMIGLKRLKLVRGKPTAFSLQTVLAKWT